MPFFWKHSHAPCEGGCVTGDMGSLSGGASVRRWVSLLLPPPTSVQLRQVNHLSSGAREPDFLSSSHLLSLNMGNLSLTLFTAVLLRKQSGTRAIHYLTVRKFQALKQVTEVNDRLSISLLCLTTVLSIKYPFRHAWPALLLPVQKKICRWFWFYYSVWTESCILTCLGTWGFWSLLLSLSLQPYNWLVVRVWASGEVISFSVCSPLFPPYFSPSLPPSLSLSLSMTLSLQFTYYEYFSRSWEAGELGLPIY